MASQSNQGHRRFLVTGSASGIGAAVCRSLAAPGTAFLVHTRRNQAGAEAVAAEIRAAGGEAEVALGDLAEPNVAAALVEDCVARFGGLDVLIANAGFADRTPIAALTDAAMTASTEAIQVASSASPAPRCRISGPNAHRGSSRYPASWRMRSGPIWQPSRPPPRQKRGWRRWCVSWP